MLPTIPRPVLVVFIALVSAVGARAAFAYADGPAPDELTLSGSFAGLAPGEKRVLTRAELRTIPGIIHRHEKPAPPLPASDLELLPIPAFLAAHPLAEGADMIIMRANDRWRSYWTNDFIASHKPWILLAVDGKTPAEGWPVIDAYEEALAPYHAAASKSDAPEGWDGYTPHHGMADATQVVEVIAVNSTEHFAPFHSGPLEKPSKLISEGRDLFMRNCITCHQGPGGVGGNLSRRPVMILQMHARHNVPYLRQFVANPKSVMPETIMPAHPHFEDRDYFALIAFLRAIPVETPAEP